MSGAPELHPGAAQVHRPWVARLESWLAWGVEIPAAALVLSSIVVLFSGVVARYLLHTSLLWSDELASLLFLWLAMLGSVIALRRGEHMRMTALVSKARPERRPLLEAVALAASLAYLAMVIWPAFQYASDEVAVSTPAMEISNAWRAAALPLGVALMGLFGVLRLLRTTAWPQIVQAALLVGAVVGAFWWAGPWFEDLGRLNLLIFFVGVEGGCVLAGIPRKVEK